MTLPSIFTIILTFVWVAQAETSPKQGEALLKTDMMVVLAHPDDETGMAATLATYAHGQDKSITNVYCTRGEGGGNMVGTHWGASLGLLREVELNQCLDILGVQHCFFLNQVDWAYTESAAMTLQKWDKATALGDLVRLVRAFRPEIMVTMNPFPRPGQHGHHQAAGMLAVEAFTAAADSKQYPDQLTREGLSPWQARKLYFRGDSVGPVAKIDASVAFANGKTGHEVAAEALVNHRSQGFGRFQRATLGRPPEGFGLVKSVLPTIPNETDLFAGLPIPAGQDISVQAPPTYDEDRVRLRFEQRPAVDAFLEWAAQQEIGHLVTNTPADLPVVMGQLKTVALTLANPTNEALEVTVIFEGPQDWLIDPPHVSASLEARSTIATPVMFTQSRPSSNDATFVARFQGDPTDQASVSLHPVPMAQATKGAASVDFTTDDGWSNAPALVIKESDVVQGKVDNADDSSGTFRVLCDADRLYVEVDVWDEQVVSNIASNDIRGHWRSDAVEICIDPTGTSEHTLTCFKVGIFPFDQAGNVRAARDADALQGPIEETAPGMQLASERTPQGYRLRTAIPWADIGLDSPLKGQDIGFNLLIYDGDKQDAATGENINESRLAWAPRSGVQGRPEDWGRIRLPEADSP